MKLYCDSEVREVVASIRYLDWHIEVHRASEFEPPVLWVEFTAPDVHTGESALQKGRIWQLPMYPTKDNIVFTAFAAIKAALEHELLECFLVEGEAVFYPHQAVDDLIAVQKSRKGRKARGA